MILGDLNCVVANTIQIFPISLIYLLQPLLACESPRSLLPAVLSRTSLDLSQLPVRLYD